MDVREIDKLWDYNQATESEARFRELLEAARAGEDKAFLVELLSQIARAQGLQAKFDEAHQTLDEAEGLLSADMQRAKVRVLLERGRVFNSSQQQAEAMPLFEEAMQLAQEAGEEFLMVDAAHMLGIAAPPEQRLEWNLRALEMAEEAQDERAQSWRRSLYNNIGYSHMEDGHYEQAMNMFQKLLDYTESKGDADFADVARWFIAKVQRLTGDYQSALAGQLALQEKQEAKQPKDAYVFEELGEIYLALGKDEERRSYFKQAHETFLADKRYVYEVKYEAERLGRIQKLSQS